MTDMVIFIFKNALCIFVLPSICTGSSLEQYSDNATPNWHTYIPSEILGL